MSLVYRDKASATFPMRWKRSCEGILRFDLNLTIPTGNPMSLVRVSLSLALVICARTAFAADQIPPELVGVWATEGAVLSGQLLLEGQAMYLGADGVGAIVGGPPPIGFKIIGIFNAEKNTLEFDIYAGQQRGRHGSVTFDPISKTIDSGTPKHDKLHRRFNTFPDATMRALGLK